MALKELLQQHTQEEVRTESDGDLSHGGDGLIAQVCGEIEPTAGGIAETPLTAEGRISLPDGYMRRSPVQAYRTPSDYAKKRVVKAVLIAAGLCLVVLLGLALLKSGLFRLR